MQLITSELDATWIEHPDGGADIDVSALCLADEAVSLAHALNMQRPPVIDDSEYRFTPAVPDRVMIVGYPFGRNGGATGVGVWVQGTIASEFHLPIDGLPRFLVDSRTRPGMSGSPVYLNPAGRMYNPVGREGLYSVAPEDTTQLVGIYSGRVSSDSDLGFVWHAKTILEVIDGGVPGSVFS
ncbi:hypothetical protein GCM10011399_09750 [Subtercola lobariae]|uniref:Serine protease n=2 Tax=Subtercola lobariae TaxID=1588641 RepID=A0A917B4H1_9MICO|nr:hypothetical protein GCM10011399_09750 [Subtercola lobariae]